MRIDHVACVLVILFGGLLAWKLVRFRWPGWTAFPLLFLVMQAVNDLGVTPLVFDLLDYQYRAGRLYTRTYGWEALQAGGLILLCYLVIAAGLISARLLSGRSGRSEPLRPQEHYAPRIIWRAWLVCLLFFAIGSVVNLFIIYQLLRGRSLGEITYERALFTDENLTTSSLYTVVRLLSCLMMIGALGMVFFSSGRALRVRVGVGAVFFALGVAVLYGGRQAVITGMICLLLLYTRGVARIPLCRLAFYLIVCMSVLIGVAHTRGYTLVASDGLAGVDVLRILRVTMIGYSRIDDTAWVIRTVPGTIPYTGVLNAVGTLGRFVPSLRVPGTDTLYGHVVRHFYGGVNPEAGIGGLNYSTAAELYAWGGWLSVVVFGYLIGLFFGAIFEWQRRDRSNPFLTFLVVLVCVRVFFFGVHARMPNIMHEVGVYLLAVAVMAALSVSSRRAVPFILLLWWNLIPGLIWKAFDCDALRALVLGSVPLLYFWAVQSLRIAGSYFQRGIYPDENCIPVKFEYSVADCQQHPRDEDVPGACEEWP